MFCFDPTTYTKIKTKHHEDVENTSDEDDNNIPVLQKTAEITIHEIRTNWEKNDFSVSLNDNELRKHNKVETRFNRGQLVTLLFDLEQEFGIENKTEKCIIQAGQTGIISNEKNDNDNDNIVEVTFWSIPLGLLALEGEDFVSAPQQLDPFSCAINSWERKISIDKDFLFPLYCEELESSM